MTDVLRELEDLEAKATPGPWNYDYNAPYIVIAEDGSGKFVLKLTTDSVGGFEARRGMDRNVDLALAARNALPALLRVAEAARTLVDMREALGKVTPGVYTDLRAALDDLRAARLTSPEPTPEEK